MPFVRGFLRVVRRGRPDNTLPGGEEPVDPDYGIEGPDIDEPVDPGFGWGGGLRPRPPMVIPKPPPGIWPPPTIEIPIQPLPPSFPGMPKPPIALPPGMIWPNPGYPVQPLPPTGPPPTVGGGPVQPPGLPPSVGGGPIEPAQKFVVLVWISGGYGWRYVVVDPSLVPTPPIAPTPEPKR